METIPQPVEQKQHRERLSWEAHEYIHTDKHPDWYWALGLLTIAGAVAAILFSDYLFAVIIVITGFVLALFASRKPDVVRFTLTQRGVRINEKLYPYQSLESFFIEELHHEYTPRLLLKSKHFFVPLLVIPLEGVDADQVHDYLLDFLMEEEHAEPLVHKVMEYFGF